MKFNTEINRFLLVGLLTVFIDFLFYNLFLLIGISYNLAKGISFLLGTFFAYVANKKITFLIKSNKYKKLFEFYCVYLFGLLINVIINDLTLKLISDYQNKVFIGFLVSTFCSASFNYLGMKFFVFKKNKHL